MLKHTRTLYEIGWVNYCVTCKVVSESSETFKVFNITEKQKRNILMLKGNTDVENGQDCSRKR